MADLIKDSYVFGGVKLQAQYESSEPQGVGNFRLVVNSSVGYELGTSRISADIGSLRQATGRTLSTVMVFIFGAIVVVKELPLGRSQAVMLTSATLLLLTCRLVAVAMSLVSPRLTTLAYSESSQHLVPHRPST